MSRIELVARHLCRAVALAAPGSPEPDDLVAMSNNFQTHVGELRPSTDMVRAWSLYIHQAQALLQELTDYTERE